MTSSNIILVSTVFLKKKLILIYAALERVRNVSLAMKFVSLAMKLYTANAFPLKSYVTTPNKSHEPIKFKSLTSVGGPNLEDFAHY